jgi:hypothetical protein
MSPDHGRREPDHVYWRRRTVLAALAAVPIAGAVWGIERALGGDDHQSGSSASGTTSDSGSDSGAAAGTASTSTKRAVKRTLIADEIKKEGTDAWDVPQVESTWNKVRGFVSRTSVEQGESFDLYVSTAAPTFTVTAYRMGIYAGGKAGRQVWQFPNIPGVEQPGPRIDPETNMRDAPWEKSMTITPDADWVPGQYLLKLESTDGGQSQIPIVIRDDAYAAPVHIQQDVTTWQAYNLWGGASLYQGDDGGSGGRSQKVSFDRPYLVSGQGNFLGGVYEIGALVESLGLEVTYSTNLDTHIHPDLVKQHKVWISPAHDEYWSLEMRQGVEAARDSGTNLMFMGANCCYRRIRLEDTDLGPSRRIVNYRVAADDPMNGKDDKRVTTSWREAPAANPESSLIGTFYESNPVDADMVVVAADAWMFKGTGIENGDSWPHVVGNEYDRVTPEMPTPKTIQVLAHSPVVIKGRRSFADMTYYTADSGAGVFSSGSIWFERQVQPGGTGYKGQIAAMVSNILKAFAEGPAGKAHPSRPNLEQLGITPGYITGIS